MGLDQRIEVFHDVMAQPVVGACSCSPVVRDKHDYRVCLAGSLSQRRQLALTIK